MFKSIMIKQARLLMIRALSKVYDGGLNCKYLEQIMCTVDESYSFDLIRKDVAYLKEKGYVRITRIGGVGTMADVREGSMTVISLTALGLEVAQELHKDPALEI